MINATLRDRSRTGRMDVPALALTVMLVTFTVAFVGTARAQEMRWIPRARLPVAIESLSCPTTRLCVAGTATGLLVSTHPAAVDARRWVQVPLPATRTGSTPAISGVACPSASLCVAVAGAEIVTSRHPASTRSRWRVRSVRLPAQDHLAGIACGSPSLCVAFAGTASPPRCCSAPRGGRVFSSQDPSGGPRAWKAVVLRDVPTYASCLPTRCVLATDDGDILAATRPTAGARAWSVSHELGAPGAVADIPVIACASATDCIAPVAGITGRGQLRGSLASVAPFSWTFTQGLRGPAAVGPESGVCVTADFCSFTASVGAKPGGSGEILETVTPGRGWTTVDVPVNDGLVISCASASFCVAGGTDVHADGAVSSVIMVGR